MDYSDVQKFMEQHGHNIDDSFRIMFTTQGYEIWEWVRKEDGSLVADKYGNPIPRVTKRLYNEEVPTLRKTLS